MRFYLWQTPNDFVKERINLFCWNKKCPRILITANDTGVGIKQENMEKVFLNGYSTKGEGRGTGLYQVKRMVENLGGEIAIESQFGTGTTVTVSLGK